MYRFIAVMMTTALLCGAVAQQSGDRDWVDGELVTFNTNGTWCWFQDERAIIDTVLNKLVVGSVTNHGATEAVVYDMTEQRVENKTNLGTLTVDDHNAPGFIITPDGKYLAMFADHYDRYNSRYAIYENGAWSQQKRFDWTKIPGGTNYTIAYSNLYYLSDEERIYNFARANNRSPNFLLSSDSGRTWTFGGQISTDNSNTYNKGYYKYWGNGKDRIDFCCTEQHPRDYTTSIYHGYIKGGKCYNSEGEVADENIFDVDDLPTCAKFTKVFAHGTKVNGVTMGRCWESDLQVYDDSTIAILFKARANNSETDHRNFYSRYDGHEWKTTYIGRAGTKMYDSEQDYTGLGALCPNDPNTIYISSPYDPGDDESTPGKREIWKGVTSDHGETWTWTAVTANSTKDNFRPIVPSWNIHNTALLWWRGTYTAAQNFDAAVVGLFYHHPVETRSNTGYGVSGIMRPSLRAMNRTDGNRIVVQYTVPCASTVTAALYSVSGVRIHTLINSTVEAGSHSIETPLSGLAPGVYLCRMRIGATELVTPLRNIR